MSKAADLERLKAFRNDLVGFVNLVSKHRTGFRAMPVDEEAWTEISSRQPRLAHQHGRVAAILRPYGQVGIHQYGMMVSRDVIWDAIHSPEHPGYSDVARTAVGHLDTVIGRLSAEVEEGAGVRSLDDLYRVTSPIYWLALIGRFIGWVASTHRGRIAGAIGAVILVVIGAVVSGAAQSLVDRLLAGL
jgi:hypothetical protein